MEWMKWHQQHVYPPCVTFHGQCLIVLQPLVVCRGLDLYRLFSNLGAFFGVGVSNVTVELGPFGVATLHGVLSSLVELTLVPLHVACRHRFGGGCCTLGYQLFTSSQV